MMMTDAGFMSRRFLLAFLCPYLSTCPPACSRLCLCRHNSLQALKAAKRKLKEQEERERVQQAELDELLAEQQQLASKEAARAAVLSQVWSSEVGVGEGDGKGIW